MPTLTIVIGGNGAGQVDLVPKPPGRATPRLLRRRLHRGRIGGLNSSVKQRGTRDLVDRAIQEHLKRGGSFGFESTYSGRSRPRLVETANAAGYAVRAVFVGTRRPEINVYRVRSRVANNTGHDVVEAEIRRRWTAAQNNLVRTAHALARIDLLDNSGRRTRQVVRIQEGRVHQMHRPTPLWASELTRRIQAQVGTATGRGRPGTTPGTG